MAFHRTMFLVVVFLVGAWALGLWMDDHLHGLPHALGIGIGDIAILAGIGAIAFWIRAIRASRGRTGP